MASYSGRRGVNVAQFLTNGNTIPSPSDVAADEHDFVDFDKDLARFTNIDFTEVNFEGGNLFNVDGEGHRHGEYEARQDDRSKRRDVEVGQTEDKGLEYVNGEFPFPSNNPFEIPASASSIPPHPIVSGYSSPRSQTSLPAGFQGYPPSHQQPFTPAPYPGNKRQSATISATNAFPSAPSPQDDNPLARQAAEEDKRRRNTAASARFRVKKKQREQALEKTAEELKARAQELEAKVGQLQKENEWLRGLVVVRGDVVKGNSTEDAEKNSKPKTDLKEEKERIETSENKKGVGTRTEVGDEEAGEG